MVVLGFRVDEGLKDAVCQRAGEPRGMTKDVMTHR